jgi:hypothetical protein
MELAEITAEIAKNPTLKTGLVGALREDVLAVLKQDGGIYRTKEEEEAFLSNYETNIIPDKVNAQIGEKIKQVYTQLDQDIEAVTGLKKGPHEKTYDFNKRVLAKLKADAAAGGGDAVLKQQLEDAQRALEERKDYVPKTELEKLQAKYFTETVTGRISSALDKHPIAIPAHIVDDNAKQQYAETQRRLITSDFLSRFKPKEANGQVVYYGEGDKLLTQANTAKPMTEADLLTAHYGSYFAPVKKAKTGAGSGGNGGDGDDIDANEADLKTKEDVTKHLQGKGLVIGGAQFNKEYARILKEYGITK